MSTNHRLVANRKTTDLQFGQNCITCLTDFAEAAGFDTTGWWDVEEGKCGLDADDARKLSDYIDSWVYDGFPMLPGYKTLDQYRDDFLHEYMKLEVSIPELTCWLTNSDGFRVDHFKGDEYNNRHHFDWSDDEKKNWSASYSRQ